MTMNAWDQHQLKGYKLPTLTMPSVFYMVTTTTPVEIFAHLLLSSCRIIQREQGVTSGMRAYCGRQTTPLNT